METKAAFLASLNDSQLGFYYAHEYNKELDELLKDELNFKQYQLYEKWKEYEKTLANENVQQSLALKDLSENVSKIMNMMQMLTTRIDNIETKLEEKLNLLHQKFSDNFERTDRTMKETKQDTKKLANEGTQLKQDFTTNTEKIICFQQKLTDESNKKMSNTVQTIDFVKTSEWILLNGKVDDILSNTSQNDDTSSMNAQTALEWLGKTEREARVYIKKNYKRPSYYIIQKTIEILNKFEDNEKIQSDGCSLLFDMIDYSDSTVHYICDNMGAIEHLMKIAQRVQGKRYHYVFRVLPCIAECNETRQKLMKYEYLTIFLNALASTTEFSFVGFFSSLVLANLLDLPESEFPQKLKKEDIENKLAAIYEEIFAKPPVNFWTLTRHCSWYLDRIITGTKAQKYVCAYAIYNGTHMVNRKTYIEAGVIPVLEKVISDPTTDSVVKKIASEALVEFKQALLEISCYG